MNLGGVTARLAKKRNAQAAENDWSVVWDEKGIRIKVWNETSLGVFPTQTELDAEETAMLQEQQAAIDKAAADKIEQDKVKASLNDLKNGTGTASERFRRCEAALVRLILDNYK